MCPHQEVIRPTPSALRTIWVPCGAILDRSPNQEVCSDERANVSKSLSSKKTAESILGSTLYSWAYARYPKQSPKFFHGYTTSHTKHSIIKHITKEGLSVTSTDCLIVIIQKGVANLFLLGYCYSNQATHKQPAPSQCWVSQKAVRERSGREGDVNRMKVNTHT